MSAHASSIAVYLLPTRPSSCGVPLEDTPRTMTPKLGSDLSVALTSRDPDPHLNAAPQVEALVKMDAEFAGPAWMFGTRSYQALSDGSFLAIYNDPKARLPQKDYFSIFLNSSFTLQENRWSATTFVAETSFV